MPKAKQPKYEDWEVDGAADTLMRAEEIKEDKPLLQKAKAVIDKRAEAISKVQKTVFPYKR